MCVYIYIITYSPNGPVKGLFSSMGLVGRVPSLPLLRKSSPKWPPEATHSGVKNCDIKLHQRHDATRTLHSTVEMAAVSLNGQ